MSGGLAKLLGLDEASMKQQAKQEEAAEQLDSGAPIRF